MPFLLSFVRRYPKQSILMLIAMLLAGMSEGVGLSAMLPLLNIAIGSQAAGHTGNSPAAERMVREGLEVLGIPPTLEALLMVIFAAIILKSGLILLANKRIGFTVAQVATDLRLEFLRALLASRWRFHLRHPIGALANSIITEASRTSKAYLCGATMMIALIQAIILVIVAFMVSGKATVAAIFGGLLILFILRQLMKKARRAGDLQTRALKTLVGQMVDSMQSIKPIKAMALENLAESVLSKTTAKLNKALRKRVISREYLRALSEPLRYALLLLGLYATLTYLKIPVATVLVYIFMIGRILQQLGKVQDEYQKMVNFESAHESLKNRIKEAKADREISYGKKPPILNKAIRLNQITFAYDNEPVLSQVSFIFPAGMITAIVGPSGSGKTTVADLVIGLLRPNEGEIWIDDLPLEQIDLQKWRQLIGYVPQESWLLHDSVYKNVTLGDPVLTEDHVVRALKAAGALEFVQAMPQGINSTVGERGYKISGGQRQRIAIARALVHKPKLLILDEATTALDPDNEMAICNALSQLRGQLTILAISHQAAVLKIADQAYRLQNGSALPVIRGGSPSILNSGESEHDADGKMKKADNPI
jgi:ATP-binding cassette subfamily C protein